MKQQLLSIADYLESLEQRIAALEEKLETLEKPDPEPVLQPATCNLQPALGSVSNIRQAISLGDRFLFQRELFANNGELMQKTLDEINDCANMDAALQSVAHFNWDPESTTYKLFLNVLKRRF